MSRNRERTEQLLLQAVGTVLQTDGFQKLGVNRVAKEAGVDKVLIYRYFGSVDGLLNAYGMSEDFWPSIEEVLGSLPHDIRQLPKNERLSLILIGLLDALRTRPTTIEIMAMELVQPSPLAKVLEDRRETWSQQILTRVFPDLSGSDDQLVVIGNLLVAGFQYLLIKARSTNVYGGIDLQSVEGWQRVTEGLRAISAFNPHSIPRSL